jgi:hypothetical protein
MLYIFFCKYQISPQNPKGDSVGFIKKCLFEPKIGNKYVFVVRGGSVGLD